jgi:hypothetical protein
MGRMRGGVVLVAGLAIGASGCGSSSSVKGDADTGNQKATETVHVEAVRTWLDPDGTKPYDNQAVAVVRNNGDKIADGVTLKLTWPDGYHTKQDEALVIPPHKQAVFLLGPFKPPPDLKGNPKAEAFVDGLKPATGDVPVTISGFKQSGCSLSGKTTNKFKKAHPGVNGFVAGMNGDKIVTGGSIFFEEPGLTPGDPGTFKATLQPLCPEGKVEKWVAYPNLSVDDLQNP